MLMRACLIFFVSCATLACGGEDTTRVSVRVYPAEGAMHDTLLTDGSSSFMELVLRGGPVPFTQRFDLNSRSGDLMDIPIGVGYSLEARGYTIDGSGNTNLVFYGASVPFGPDPGASSQVTVQVGRSDCVGLNRPSVYRSPLGKADMGELRIGMTATALPDGRVLVIGGGTLDSAGNLATVSNTVEVYDPVNGQFLPTNIFLNEPRAFHTATLLQTGEVMIVGGRNSNGPLASASTINIDGPLFEAPVTVAPDFQARFDHAASRLPDGSVLIVGGTDANGNALDSTYRYFPTDNSFRLQGRMKYPRTGHSLSPMKRGADLAIVTGGKNGGTVHGSVEIFTILETQRGCQDGQMPQELNGCWFEIPSLELDPPRWGHAAVAANGGEEIILIGGYTTEDKNTPTDEINVIPGSLATLYEAGNLLTPRGEVSAIETSDGANPFILVSGGRRASIPVQAMVRLVREEANGAVRYNVQSLRDGCIQPNDPVVGTLPEARWAPAAVRLPNDVILLVGGGNQSPNGYSASRRAELYFPPHIR